MREVQPEINLLVSPIKENLIYLAPPGSPQWEFRRGGVVTALRRFARTTPPRPVDPLGDADAGEREVGSSTTGPRSGRAARRRCSTPTAPARSWTCPSSRSCRPGSTTGTGSGAAARGSRSIHAPRLRDVVRMHLRSPDVQLRPHPWQPKRNSFSNEGNDLGVPARVFPQWLRCTGCDMLGLLVAVRLHATPTRSAPTWPASSTRSAPGGPAQARRPAAPPFRPGTCSPARRGHLDEFPYDLWVHRGKQCAVGGDSRA